MVYDQRVAMIRAIRRLVLVLVVLAAPFVWSVTISEPPEVPVGAPGGLGTSGTGPAQPAHRPGPPVGGAPPRRADPPAFLGVVTEPGEAVVTGLMPSSPAEAAGLRTGDVIRTIDGQAVRTPDELRRLIGSRRPGDRIVIRFSRGDQLYETGATLGRAPAAQRPATRR